MKLSAQTINGIIHIEFSGFAKPEDFFKMVNFIKSLPNRFFNSRHKRWEIPYDAKIANALRQKGFPIEIPVEVPEKKEKELNIKFEIPGLQKTLKPFQKQGVAFLEKQKGRALIASEMGLGKTLQAISFLQLHPELRPAVIVCPASAKFVWQKEFRESCNISNIEILQGRKNKGAITSKIVIINYDILKNRVEEIKSLRPKIIVLDECFPAGTKVSTPKGCVNIESLKAGDLVYNAIGTGVITKTFKSKAKSLIKLYLSNGKNIVVTPNHPFLTQEGWIPACNLLKKKLFTKNEVFSIMGKDIILKSQKQKESTSGNEMQYMQKRTNNKANKKQTQKEKKNRFLRILLFSEMEMGTFCITPNNIHAKKQSIQANAQKKSTNGAAMLSKNENKQPNALTINSTKSKQKAQRNQALPINSRRKRKTNSTSSVSLNKFTRKRMETRISNFIRKIKSRISVQLQSRYWESKNKILDRSRWSLSSQSQTKEKRQKERNNANKIRVERIEILESRNYISSSKNTKENLVYNLEIKNHPSYFAQGIMVHNCHAIKDPTAQRTKAVRTLCEKIPHIICLSGTPITNRPIEFFSCLNLLAPEKFPNRFRFALRYCNARKSRFGWDMTGASNTEELNRILIQSIMIRHKKSEVLPELSPKTRTAISFEINNKKEYMAIEKDVLSWIKKNEGLEAALKASKAEFLVKIEELKQSAARGKISAVKKWIEDFVDSDEKLVVFCTHTETINSLHDSFPKISVKFDGSTLNSEREETVKKFQTDKNCKVFFGNIKAAGEAITLTAASNVAFMEFDWTPGRHLQAEDRVHRIGQKDSVTAYYLVAQNTIDERLAEILNKKSKILEEILDGKAKQEESVFNEILTDLTKQERS